MLRGLYWHENCFCTLRNEWVLLDMQTPHCSQVGSDAGTPWNWMGHVTQVQKSCHLWEPGEEVGQETFLCLHAFPQYSPTFHHLCLSKLDLFCMDKSHIILSFCSCVSFLWITYAFALTSLIRWWTSWEQGLFQPLNMNTEGKHYLDVSRQCPQPLSWYGVGIWPPHGSGVDRSSLLWLSWPQVLLSLCRWSLHCTLELYSHTSKFSFWMDNLFPNCEGGIGTPGQPRTQVDLWMVTSCTAVGAGHEEFLCSLHLDMARSLLLALPAYVLLWPTLYMLLSPVLVRTLQPKSKYDHFHAWMT
jgi:hypothetical protein